MKLDSFISRSYVAQSPNTDCEETINLFLEIVESGKGKSNFTFYKSPGLKKLVTFPNAGAVRGMLPLNQLPGGTDGVWVCAGQYVYLIDSNGMILATRGPIPTDGLGVSMAASPTILVIATAGSVYYIDGVAPYLHGPITWFGAGITIADVGFLNTYFVFLDQGNGDGFYYSNPDNPNSGSPLQFISAEASGNKYTRMLVEREEIWLQGSLITQPFYDNSANNPSNPFAPNLSGIMPIGTVAKAAATSVSQRLCWLGQSKSSVGVAWTNDGGYVARRISNHAVEYAWSTYSQIDDAVSWHMTIKGHPLWRIWFPSADVTWEYDLAVDDWRKVLSFDENTGQYHAHLGRVACAAFDSILVGDRTSPIVYKTSLDYYDDAGARSKWMRRTPVLSNENKRTSFPWFELDVQPGVGDGTDPSLGSPESDPQIMMRFSNDWAQSWSNERQRSMGKKGEYTKRVIWTRNGAARQRVFEASGTASVKTVINGTYLRDPGVRST